MYLFLSPVMFLRLKIPLLKEEVASSSKPTLDHPNCDILAQGLIGLIGYSYQQVATSFPEAHQQRTPRLSVLGPE
jgi:hypothetical protein